jgi:hypothetical protein
MFNLEQSITDWRKQMLAAGIKSPVPLEELENHLREGIERQMKSGRAEAEAFTLAVQNVGPSSGIQAEFEKVEAIVEALKWKHGQIFFGVSVGLLQIILVGSVLLNSEMQLDDRLSGLGAIATSYMLAIITGLVVYRISPAIHSTRKRQAIIVMGGGVPVMVWSSIFAPFVLTGHEFPFAGWLTSVLWCLCPMLGLFSGLIWGIESAAQKGKMTAGS